LANLPYCGKATQSNYRSGLGGQCGNQALPRLSKPSNKSGSFAIFAAIRRANQSRGVLL
jgi:hypothetical protein